MATAKTKKTPAPKKKPVSKTQSSKKSAPLEQKKINLALQGGGAHGAFTWGVLDALLADERIDIEAITATSAGAVNGAVLIYGMAKGGRTLARQLLAQLWEGIAGASAIMPFTPNVSDNSLSTFGSPFTGPMLALDFITRMFSPYEFNPFDLNPLRDILDSLVKFDTIRKNKEIKFFVNATNVKTGKTKIFKTHEMTRDMILASACLPFLFKTVFVEGEPYWDGGYTGNPALFPLYYHCTSNDVLLLGINPLLIQDVPVHAADILDRVNEVSFNSSLMHEMRALAFVKKLLHKGKLSHADYKDMHIHMIEATEMMLPLGRSSKMNTDWHFLNTLRDLGEKAAQDWLKKNYSWIGQRSTIDINEVFL